MAARIGCKIEGCQSDSRTLGMCKMHYERVRKWGDPHFALRIRCGGVRKRCSVEGCDRYTKARGLCKKHYGAEYSQMGRDRTKAMEQAFMATKEQYSQLAQALGFDGDPFFGDPYAKHEEILERARSLANS